MLNYGRIDFAKTICSQVKPQKIIFLGSQHNVLSVFDKIVEMHFPLLVVCLICERQCCGCGYAVRACPVLITRNAFLPAQPLILSPQNCPLLFHCPEGWLQLLVSHSWAVKLCRCNIFLSLSLPFLSHLSRVSGQTNVHRFAAVDNEWSHKYRYKYKYKYKYKTDRFTGLVRMNEMFGCHSELCCMCWSKLWEEGGRWVVVNPRGKTIRICSILQKVKFYQKHAYISLILGNCSIPMCAAAPMFWQSLRPKMTKSISQRRCCADKLGMP